MNANNLAGMVKQATKQFPKDWQRPSGDDRRSFERNRLGEPSNDVDDKSNPFIPSAALAVAPPVRETLDGAFRVEDQRQALLELRARLQGDVTESADRALSGCGIESTCSSPDTADRAGEVVEQDLALGLLLSASGTVDQIEAALERMEDGSYGCCVQCGMAIPAARLAAIPYATRCVHCAAQQERVA